jgi:hypothetical protein
MDLNLYLKGLDCQTGSKTRSHNLCLQQTHHTTKNTQKIKVRGWEKTYQTCRNQKQAEKFILISSKADFMQKISQKKEKSLHANKGNNLPRSYPT